jgi:hypothetical protein
MTCGYLPRHRISRETAATSTSIDDRSGVGAEPCAEPGGAREGEPLGAASIDADLSATHLMAVTAESAVCPIAPTTDPMFTAELR